MCQHFQIQPPEVDSGSAAALVWVKRFEKMMLLIAYVLTFIIVFTAAVVSKGPTFFVIAQVTHALAHMYRNMSIKIFYVDSFR